MVRVDFDHLIRELSAFFERTKPPASRTMDLWFNEVQHIPVKYLSPLIAWAKTLETWPRNLPAALRSKCVELMEEDGSSNKYAIHPRRLNPQNYAKQDCSKCAGKGLIPWPMDWPMHRDEDGKMITRKFTPQALCPCTDEAEYGF